MFYDLQLLSLKHRGKFSICWAAATMTSNNALLSKEDFLSVDIVKLCDQILKFVQSSSGQAGKRFSLYLSSQLCYGTCIIFSRQVDYFQENFSLCLYYNRRLQEQYKALTSKENKKKKRIVKKRSRTEVVEEEAPLVINIQDLPLADNQLPPPVTKDEEAHCIIEDNLQMRAANENNLGIELGTLNIDDIERLFAEVDDLLVRENVQAPEVSGIPSGIAQDSDVSSSKLQPVTTSKSTPLITLDVEQPVILPVPMAKSTPLTSIVPSLADIIEPVALLPAKSSSKSRKKPIIFMDSEIALSNESRYKRICALDQSDVQFINLDKGENIVIKNEEEDIFLGWSVSVYNMGLIKRQDWTPTSNKFNLPANIGEKRRYMKVSREHEKLTSGQNLRDISKASKTSGEISGNLNLEPLLTIDSMDIEHVSKNGVLKKSSDIDTFKKPQNKSLKRKKQNELPSELETISMQQPLLDAEISYVVGNENILQKDDDTRSVVSEVENIPLIQILNSRKSLVEQKLNEFWRQGLMKIKFEDFCPVAETSRRTAGSVFQSLCLLHAERKIRLISKEDSLELDEIVKY